MQLSSQEESTNSSWRSVLARWVPLGLLVAVAGIQMFLAGTHALVPWKGGGFGMFSTVDTLEERAVRYELFDSTRGEVADVLIRFNDPKMQADHERLESRLRLLNFPARSEAQARRILSMQLISGGGSTQQLLDHYHTLLPSDSLSFSESRNYLTPLQSGDTQTEPLRRGAGVRISLWRRTFDTTHARAGWGLVETPMIVGTWPEEQP